MKNENFQIRVLPSGRYIKAKPDRSLMESLMNQNIFLRSDCGGKGVCKKCRVEIISKEGGSQLKEACQLMVTKDISINIPEISMLSSHIISKAPTLLPSIFK
ncbi:MAG: 2Fe-2S iron-sulfur cluster binding domain-containing protein, partial [Desulfobacula sp.]|nr:2Fe-2S iron-sulfur cluster binding domain-containing protein [Desulfobacula sp.]